MKDDTTFDAIFDREYHYYLHLKRLYLLQTKVLEACDGRPIKNDLVYQQLLFASLDGLFVRLANFQTRLIEFLNTLKNDHLDRFKRNNKAGLAVDPSAIRNFGEPDPGDNKVMARILTKKHEEHFEEVYDRVFPEVKKRGEGRPRHADFDRLADALREVFKPIKSHRDTVVAHWDEKQEPATVPDLKKAVEHVEGLLKDLFFISKLGTCVFELGGVAASVTRTSKELAELILGEHRVRRADPKEMEVIYMMGFDAWADGHDRKTYLAGCRSSPKYAKGSWYVLEDIDGKAVSALITYPLDPVNGKPAVGIGSIATDSGQRRRGLAGQLLWDVMTLFHERDGSCVFYLHADINPKLYEGLDFVALPPVHQLKSGTTTMIRCAAEVRDALLNDPAFKPPGYF